MSNSTQNNPVTEDLTSGHLVAGYTINRKIGEGAMAVLYLVTDKDGRQFSLKMPRQRLGVDPVSLVSFENELRLAPYLEDFDHAYKPQVIHEGDEKYMLMEYIEGVNLWTYLNTNGCLNEDEAISLIKKVVYALSKLHEMRIIHLDIKLSNIMITSDGEIRLVDFGLANHLDLPDLIHESFYEPKGTPCYIAPEQFIGVRDDLRSDIFSLGVMLYEITTNKLPFNEGYTSLDVINRIKNGFDLPNKYNASLSEAFNSVVATCLATAPDMRYTSMQELYEMLGMWDDGIPVNTIIRFKESKTDNINHQYSVTELLKPAYRAIRNIFDTRPNDFQSLKQWAAYRHKNNKEKPYRILVAISLDDNMQLTPFSMEIIEEAYHLARLQKTAVTIVSIINNNAGMASVENEAMINNTLCNKARLAISNLIYASARSDIAVGINVQAGSLVDVIENCTTNYDADMLVMGSRKKPTFSHYMGNNNGARILAAAKCNTYIVHEGKGIMSKMNAHQDALGLTDNV